MQVGIRRTTASSVSPITIYALACGFAFVVGWLVSKSELKELVALVAGACLILIFIRYPIVGVVSILVASTDFFNFVTSEHLPAFQLGPGLRLNLSDIQLIGFFVVSIVYLQKRNDWTRLAGPMIFLIGGLFTQLVVSLALKRTDLDSGLFFFRNYFGFAFFFIALFAIRSYRDMAVMTRVLQVMLVISVSIQFIETALGHPIDLGLNTNQYYSEGVLINVMGEPVLYLWNRATLLTYITSILSFSLFLNQGPAARYSGAVAVMGIVAILLALVRQWYIYLILGLSLVLLLSRPGLRKMKTLLGGFILVSAAGAFDLLAFKGAFLNKLGGDSLVRLEQLFHMNTQSSYTGRADIMMAQLDDFFTAPLIGKGMGTEAYTNIDTGFLNVLVQVGVLGILPLLYVLYVTFRRSAHCLAVTKRTELQGEPFAIGVSAALAGLAAAFFITHPVFFVSSGIIPSALLIALVARLHDLAERETNG